MSTLPLEPPGDPIYSTRLTPGLPNHGERVGIVARATGTPLMPWQQWAATVATQRKPDGSFLYPIVVVTVPRQSGKTTLIRSICVERCVSFPGCQVFYTAQKGKVARRRWDDSRKALLASPFRTQVRVRLSAGSEAITFPNDSAYQPFAPTMDALHSETPALVVLDEPWAFDAELGEALMQAITPAQATISYRQVWLVSTQGTAASTFFHDFVDRGLAGEAGICLIDYGIADDEDVYDPQVWVRRHPGFVDGAPFVRADGDPQITVEYLQHEADTITRASFERGYGNRRTKTKSLLIPDDVWRALAETEDRRLVAPADTSQLTLAYSCTESAGTVVAVWRHGGILQSKIVLYRDGTSWMADKLAQLSRSWRPKALAVWNDGPVAEVTDQLERLGVKVHKLTGAEYATSCGAVMRTIKDAELVHDGTDAFTSAAAGVAMRNAGDGFRWSMRDSRGDIAPMVALTAGAWSYDHAPVEYGKPFIASVG